MTTNLTYDSNIVMWISSYIVSSDKIVALQADYLQTFVTSLPCVTC